MHKNKVERATLYTVQLVALFFPLTRCRSPPIEKARTPEAIGPVLGVNQTPTPLSASDVTKAPAHEPVKSLSTSGHLRVVFETKLKEVGSLSFPKKNRRHDYVAIIDRLLGMCSRLKKERDEYAAQVASLERKIEYHRREFMLPPYNVIPKESDR